MNWQFISLYCWPVDLFYRSDVLYILHCLVHVSKVGFVHPTLSLPSGRHVIWSDLLDVGVQWGSIFLAELLAIYLSIYPGLLPLSVCYFLTMQIVTLLFFYKNKTLQIQANDSAPEVNTTSGTIVGKLETLPNGKTVYEYLGIPYADAPVKEYRWAAPRRPKNWTGTKETKEFGAACPQPEFNIPNLKREKRNGKMNKVF